MIAASMLLAFVTIERLGELLLARRNTKALLAKGAYEAAPGQDEPMLSPEKIRTDGALPSRQQSSHRSDFCIPIRFITSPNIFSKALRATTSA